MPQPEGRRHARGEQVPDDGALLIDALIRGIEAHDAASVAQALGVDVQLSVPPLRIHVSGVDDVTRAVLEVADAFDALTYRMSSRYLSPDQVTDEAVLTGVHTRDLLGAPPTGRASSVTVRVIASHDRRAITKIAIWPDVAAVRGLCDELARHIERRQAGAAGAMVSALRSSIPTGSARVVQGSAREAPDPSFPDPAVLAATVITPNDQRSPGRTDGMKVPVPRRTRRRRAVVAGAVMLSGSVALVTWVSYGALNVNGRGQTVLAFPLPTPTGTRSGTAPAKVTASGAGASNAAPSGVSGPTGPAVVSPRPSPSPTPSVPPVTFDKNNEVTLSADLLFDTGSATLVTRARGQLDQIIRKVKVEKRIGRIVVSGFTDNEGGVPYNLDLSTRRAEAVAAALRQGLPGAIIRSKGYGELNAKYKNSTAEGKMMNRRVTVQVPPRSA